MFNIQNRIRTNPLSFIDDLNDLLNSFVDDKHYIKDGVRWKTKEGPAAVEGCIEYMKTATAVGALKWSD
jgi:hypothetical protein